MIFLYICAIFLSFFPAAGLLENASHYSKVLQLTCLQQLPQHTEFRDALGALLCGQSLDSSHLKTSLQRLSLIHLFVVSGSHLIWLEQLLSILRVPVFLRTFILLIYSLATGWQPPAVRALFQIVLKILLHRFKVYLPADLRVLLAGFLTLSFFPSWWNSLSLLMSWSASLALTWNFWGPSKNLSWQKTLLSQTLIWMLMLAPLWGLGSLHPLSCLYNLLLGPVVGFGLIPLALIATVFPSWGVLLFERALTGLLAISPSLTEPILQGPGSKLTPQTLWLWILIWHLCFHAFRIHCRRRQEIFP